MNWYKLVVLLTKRGFLGGSGVKNPPANTGVARGVGSIPGPGRSPGIENGNPLQYSCLENSMDRGAWQAMVHGGHKESDMSTHILIKRLF